MNRSQFDSIYQFYIGRIVRHKGERKVIAKSSIDANNIITIIFVDGTKCVDIKDIELDGRK